MRVIVFILFLFRWQNDIVLPGTNRGQHSLPAEGIQQPANGRLRAAWIDGLNSLTERFLIENLSTAEFF